MTVQEIQEKYFVFTENEGRIEAVYWCKTLDEAKDIAEKRKKEFPSESEEVFIGEIIG